MMQQQRHFNRLTSWIHRLVVAVDIICGRSAARADTLGGCHVFDSVWMLVCAGDHHVRWDYSPKIDLTADALFEFVLNESRTFTE